MSATRARRVPDFFIAGAPRCGTTALYRYLRGHPGLFLPHTKEPCHLCPDLDSGSADDAVRFMRDEERYFALYRDVPAELPAGEACVLYMYSAAAVRLIGELSPRARLIVMLRDPVEQIYSHHAVRRAGGEEDLDFAAALDAEGDRAHGRRLPARPRNLAMYQYRRVAHYSEPLERLFEHFGRDRVRVMLLEELSREPARLLGETLEFLGVDPSYAGEFGVINANRTPGRGPLSGALRSTRVVSGAKRIVPHRLRPAAARVAELLLRSGSREQPRAPMDEFVHRRLIDEFQPEVARLSVLLGRDVADFWPGYGGR